MKLYIISILLLLTLSTCKKHHKCNDESNPDCENYNPCFGKNIVYTNFIVTYASNGFPLPPKECRPKSYDTIFSGSIRLEIPEGSPDNSSYTWQVGTDTTKYKDKTLEINLLDWLIKGNWESNVPVTLTIKTPYNGCIKPDDTLIKVTRNVFFTQKDYRQGVFYGQWEGSSKHDSFYAYKLVVGMSSFRKTNIDPTGEVFFLITPFADSFLTFRNPVLNNSDPCEKRQLNAFSQPLHEEGYVYAILSERIYEKRTRFSFWVRKPGEEEKKYVFNGNFVHF